MVGEYVRSVSGSVGLKMVDFPMGCLSFCVFGDISMDFTLSIWLFFSFWFTQKCSSFKGQTSWARSCPLPPRSALAKKKKKNYSCNFDVLSVTVNASSESFSCLFFMCSMYYRSYVDLRDERSFSPLYVHEQITLAEITGRERRSQEEKYKSVGVTVAHCKLNEENNSLLKQILWLEISDWQSEIRSSTPL